MIDSYPDDRVLIGETYLPDVMALDKWYGGANKDELQLPMDTQVGVRSTLNASTWRLRLNEAQTGIHGSLPLLVYDNHDNSRLDRYCKESNGAVPGADCKQIQKMLETILLTSRDVALIYYGDEIGMATDTAPTEPNRRRDAERTPMQWTPGKNAGFSTADKTWLPVLPDFKTVNVEVETSDPGSLLAWHKALIELRRTNPILRDGNQNLFASGNESVVAYTRAAGGKQVVVLTNFSGGAQETKMGSLSGKRVQILKANFAPDIPSEVVPDTLTLPPYGALVAEVD
jgi:alpha-glucosidase